MNTKTYINKIGVLAVLVVLLSGFQLNSTANDELLTFQNAIGIEKAYAGPCGRDGCVGGKAKCSEVKILWGVFKKTCFTKALNNKTPDK